VKPGKRLVRRVGLRTNTPLRAKKPTKRDPAVPGNSLVNPIKRASTKPKRRNTDPAQSTKDLVQARSAGVCEIQIPGKCTRIASDVHHRSGRGMGGTSRPEINQASNLLHACRPCHHAVTDTKGRRAEYERDGWIVRRSADALTQPVLYRGQRMLLDNHGGKQPAPEKREVA
jgi:5-methylcytosine-specific restriction protein A